MRPPYYILLLITLLGCSYDPKEDFDRDKVFPEVVSLSEFEETAFLPTLETAFDPKINGIYSASLVLAWNEIRKVLSEPIVKINSKELQEIDKSQSYKGVLADHEFHSSIEVDDSTLRAKVFFKKSLPFIIPLEKHADPISFLTEDVLSFGFKGPNKAADIIYYADDADFAIRLIPKDTNHEIILIKSYFKGPSSFREEIDRLEKSKIDFENNKNESNHWRYYFNDQDYVSIPIIAFHIETNYTETEGTKFSTKSKEYFIETMYQRTAFVLNEKGAEIESAAEITATEEMEEDLPKPKKMVFDKAYLILLKRKDCPLPYFTMYVANTDLMQLN
jgi:hypothetical protein